MVNDTSDFKLCSKCNKGYKSIDIINVRLPFNKWKFVCRWCFKYKEVITLDKDEQRKMHEHMAKVTEAITKINHGEKLNDEDIREIFKSLMNAQMVVSDTNEKLEKELDTQIQKLKDSIKKLEDFLFRDYSKDKE